jgi:molecular chaperone DnaK
MSKEDIEKAVHEAEKFAEEDKKQKEAVEVKNMAENTIFQTEKTLGELGDKVSDSDKAPVNDAIAKLRETIKGGNTEAIKADTEALQKAFYPIAEKLYQAQAGQQGGNPNGGAGYSAGGDQNYYDAGFEDKTGN